VLRDLRTDTAVGHVRVATIGLPRTENTHPFRFRHWVFAHQGTLDAFDRIRDALLESVPDFLRRNIRGQTDSELLFHLFLAFLHDAGKLDDPNLSVAIASQAVRAMLAFAERRVADAGGRRSVLNVVLTNGRILLATRHGAPLHTMQIQGLADCGACRERMPDFGDPKPIPHEHLRSVLVVSDGIGGDLQGWNEVPENSLVTVDRELEVAVASLRPEA